MESFENMGIVHGGCMEKKKQQVQENFEKSLAEIRKNEVFFVKKAFEFEEKKEYMWVEVVQIDDKSKKFIGTLDNDPALCTNLKCGDCIEVNFSEVIEFTI